MAPILQGDILMKDSLLTKLSQMGIEAIDWTKMTLGQIVAFIEREAPQVLQQWIQWNFWISFIWFIIGFINLIIFLLILRAIFQPYYDTKRERQYTSRWKYWDDEYNEGTAFIALGAVIHLVVSIAIVLLSLEWIQIWIAPKLWVLENIKELFK